MKAFNILFIGIALFASSPLIAQKDKPFTKQFNESFSISPSGKVNLDNRYGKIDVKSWDQPKVSIAVTISVKNASQKEAEAVFSEIVIQFKQEGDQVSARTVIEDSKTSWGLFSSKKPEYSIDYEVRMPVNAQLDLNNKYGNVFIDQLNGLSRIHLSYGNLKTGKLLGNSDMELAYSKGISDELGNTHIKMKYSKLDISSAQNINAQTAYSKMAVQNAASLSGEMKYDGYQLSDINEINITMAYSELAVGKTDIVRLKSKYTNTEISQLGKSLKADLSYGNISIKKTDAAFTGIDINGTYSDVKLANPPGDFRVTAETAFGGIKLPESVTVTRDEEQGSHRSVAAWQSNAKSDKQIVVRLKYGGFKLY